MSYLANIFASGLDTLYAFQQKVGLEYLLESLTHSISMIPIFTTARSKGFLYFRVKNSILLIFFI